MQVVQHFFNRHNGVSCAPFSTANVSFSVGDDAASVMINRRRIKEQLGASFLLSARQVHDDKIYSLKEPLTADLEVDGYDGLVTHCTGVALLIQQADCQGVLLHDRINRIIGAIHCGWRGSVVGILEKGVKVMVDDFGADVKQIRASISPSLGPCCAEFVNHALELPPAFLSFRVTENNFDFWKISTAQLVECGLCIENISQAGICTECDENYFSHRRAVKQGKKTTGRHCSVILQR